MHLAPEGLSAQAASSACRWCIMAAFLWLTCRSLFHAGRWQRGHSDLMMPGPSSVSTTHCLQERPEIRDCSS